MLLQLSQRDRDAAAARSRGLTDPEEVLATHPTTLFGFPPKLLLPTAYLRPRLLFAVLLVRGNTVWPRSSPPSAMQKRPSTRGWRHWHASSKDSQVVIHFSFSYTHVHGCRSYPAGTGRWLSHPLRPLLFSFCVTHHCSRMIV
jgi:hypothetical protein